MRTKSVQDLMIPISEYVTVSQDATLNEAVAALKQSHADSDQDKYRHRAVLIKGADQQIIGKMDLHTILKALEPKYEDMFADNGPAHLGFTRKYQKAMFGSFKLWQDPINQICEKAARTKVSNFVTRPTENEIIEPDAPLGEAVHQLVLGRHQSLLVNEGRKIIGILRLTDVFETLIDMIFACEI
ncbi:MAG: hypothetical protein CSA23_04745 [Deltaproteobacteria bacterium]|nr:MAG: hypothetical protein CSA23_04745 [Deltaproteobacteria bacterium]